MPRRNKPRRVDLYYSSWFIRAGNQSFSVHLFTINLLCCKIKVVLVMPSESEFKKEKL